MYVCEMGKTAFRYHAPHSWNKLQDLIRLDCVLTLEQFKFLLKEVLVDECSCLS